MFKQIRKILTQKEKPSLDVIIYDEGGLLLVKLIIKSKIEAKMICYWKNQTGIYIADIAIKNDKKVNHGYGSLMMNKLIQYAEEYI